MIINNWRAGDWRQTIGCEGIWGILGNRKTLFGVLCMPDSGFLVA